MPLDIIVDNDIYFTDSFKVIVRSCKEKLLLNARTLALTDKSFMYAHRNNFYTFLRGLNIDERVIWPTAFINNILDPTGGFTHLTTIYICNIEDLDQLLTQLRTTRN